MDLQLALTGLYENASLTSELDDEAADALLEWGAACVRRIYLSAEFGAEPEPSVQLRAVRRLMRAVNRWVPAASSNDRATNQAALITISERAAVIRVNAQPDEADLAPFLDVAEQCQERNEKSTFSRVKKASD